MLKSTLTRGARSAYRGRAIVGVPTLGGGAKFRLAFNARSPDLSHLEFYFRCGAVKAELAKVGPKPRSLAARRTALKKAVASALEESVRKA